MIPSEKLVFASSKAFWVDHVNLSGQEELVEVPNEDWDAFKLKNTLELNPPHILLNCPIRLGVSQENTENKSESWQIPISHLGLYLELSEKSVDESEEFWQENLNSHRGFLHPVALVLNSLNLNAFVGSNLILISLPSVTWVIVSEDNMIQEIHPIAFDLENETELFIDALDSLVEQHLIPELRFSKTPSYFCLGAELPNGYKHNELNNIENHFIAEDLNFEKLTNKQCFLELYQSQKADVIPLLSFNMEPLHFRELWKNYFKISAQVSVILLAVLLFVSLGFWGVGQGLVAYNKSQNQKLEKELIKLEEVKLKLDSLEGQKNIFVNLLSKRSSSNEVLTDLSQKIPKSTWISNSVFTGNTDVEKIELEGYAINEDELSQFMLSIASMGRVQLLSTERIKGRSIVKKTGIRSNNKDIVKFRIEVLR